MSYRLVIFRYLLLDANVSEGGENFSVGQKQVWKSLDNYSLKSFIFRKSLQTFNIILEK